MSEAIHHILLERSTPFNTLHNIISENGVQLLQRKRDDELFEYLVKTIIGQQLSISAANSIWIRLKNCQIDSAEDLFSFCTEYNLPLLKSCGLSAPKAKAIILLKKAFEDDDFQKELSASSELEHIVRCITSLWGLGSWSAEMTAIFFYAKENVWSYNDVALTRGISSIAALDRVDTESILTCFEPFKSYLALHTWKALDDNLI